MLALLVSYRELHRLLNKSLETSGNVIEPDIVRFPSLKSDFFIRTTVYFFDLKHFIN